jgi:hypothetical protein
MFAAGMHTASAQELRPNSTQLQWNGWNVTIKSLSFVSSVKGSFGDSRTPDPDSEFVDLGGARRHSSFYYGTRTHSDTDGGSRNRSNART